MLVSSKYFANQLVHTSELFHAQIKDGVLTLVGDGNSTDIEVAHSKDTNWFDIQNINWQKVLKCLQTIEEQPITLHFNETGLFITFCF